MNPLTPTEMVLGNLVDERFPELARSFADAGVDPGARDAFVLDRAVVELLRELRPDEGFGEAVDELVAFVHAAFLHWRDDGGVLEVDRETLDRVISSASPAAQADGGPTRYVTLPARRIWGGAVAGAPPEPLDGWYVRPRADQLEVVAVFGLHPNRPGLTVVQVTGPRPGPLVRPDGSAPFAPTVEGGRAAGLWEVAGAEELLELAFRVEGWLAGSPPWSGRRRLVVA